MINEHDSRWVSLEIQVVDSLTSEDDGNELFKSKDGIILCSNFINKPF